MSTSKHTRRLGQSGLEVGPIAYGLWRFVGNDTAAARKRILAQKDPERLERWLERAAVAASVAAVLDEPN